MANQIILKLLDPLLSKNALYYEDVSDLPSKEIDFLEDFEEAKILVDSIFYK